MSDDEKKAVVAAAFDRLSRRILAASSVVNDRTRVAVRAALAQLRRRVEADPDWVDRIMSGPRKTSR